MNEDDSFFQQFKDQTRALWQQLSFPQKASIMSVIFASICLFTFIIISHTSERYTPLFVGAQVNSSDTSEVLGYLDNKGIPYTLKDKLILVPYNKANSLRMELAEMGLPKHQNPAGFELFDSPTWIKGEKELQVLEMRALKGQLESDITSYDNILSANISLDISPPRPFGGSIYQNSAAVILKLRPGTRLSNSELRAITYYISGAVRGLTPNMISISDTTGHLYQAINPEGDIDNIRNEEIALEDHLKAKIDGLLAMVFGIDNFYSTVQVVMSREQRTEHKTNYSEISSNKTGGSLTPTDSFDIKALPGKIQSISATVLVDNTVLNRLAANNMNADQLNADQIKEKIGAQIKAIIQGYRAPIDIAVNFVDLNKVIAPPINEETVWAPENRALIKPTLIALVILLILATLITIFIKTLGIKISPSKPHDENIKSQKNMLSEIHRKIQQNPEHAAEKLKDWIKRS